MYVGFHPYPGHEMSEVGVYAHDSDSFCLRGGGGGPNSVFSHPKYLRC